MTFKRNTMLLGFVALLASNGCSRPASESTAVEEPGRQIDQTAAEDLPEANVITFEPGPDIQKKARMNFSR